MLRREVAHAPLAFTLTEKPAGGPRRPVARLLLLAEAPGVAVSFDPVVNDDQRLRLRGLRGLRRWAYTGSRRGRQLHRQLPARPGIRYLE